ncbi:MAG: hypothetical protein PHO01_12580 [Desulfotomaculaceae bacterium]|nr:hypothetical protein [Desulfotomaculaceae bacterium]
MLLNYEEYRRLRQAEKECKRLALKLALGKARSHAREAAITEDDMLVEVRRQTVSWLIDLLIFNP